MGGIFFAAHRGKIEANSTLIDTLERGIKKGGCFVEQSPFWGCFYEAKTRKIIACEVRKPLILLHFSKNPISPLAPIKKGRQKPPFFNWQEIQDENRLNATPRWGVAREGSTERLHNFIESKSPAPEKERPSGLSFFRGRKLNRFKWDCPPKK